MCLLYVPSIVSTRGVYTVLAVPKRPFPKGNGTTLRKSYVTGGPDDTNGRLLRTRRRARLQHRIWEATLGLTPRRTGALAALPQCSASLLARADRGTHRQCPTQCLRPTRPRPRRQRTTPRRRAPRASSSPSPRCVPRSVRSPQQAALTVFRVTSKSFWRSWCRKWVRSIPFAVERECPRAVLNIECRSRTVVSKFFLPKTPPAPAADPASSLASVPQAQVPGQATPVGAANPAATAAAPAWPLGIPLAMHVHLSTSPNGDVFSKKWTSGYRKDQDADLPSLVWTNITFGDWSEKRTADFTVNLPPVRLKQFLVSSK